MNSNGLVRYDEIYDESGYLGIGKYADGDFYLATDVDAAIAQAKREVLDRLDEKLDSLFHLYFHTGLSRERLVVEALDEWCQTQANKVGA